MLAGLCKESPFPRFKVLGSMGVMVVAFVSFERTLCFRLVPFLRFFSSPAESVLSSNFTELTNSNDSSLGVFVFCDADVCVREAEALVLGFPPSTALGRSAFLLRLRRDRNMLPPVGS